MARKIMHHVCIQTEKYKQSLNFYTNIMGFEIVKETPDFHTRAYNTWLELDGFMIELQTAKKGDTLNPWSSKNAGLVHMCFLVDNIEKEYKRIIEAGYNDFKVKNKEIIYNVEGGKLFKIKAPEGTEIEIRDSQIYK